MHVRLDARIGPILATFLLLLGCPLLHRFLHLLRTHFIVVLDTYDLINAVAQSCHLLAALVQHIL